MLSYRHAYHAGNHADILKHITLSLILGHLDAKEKPYTVFDTHAGAGEYDLSDERAVKTGEAERGIMKLVSRSDVPREAEPYMSFVKDCLARGMYPGSPEIERHFMRRDDVLVLCELHNEEAEILRSTMKIFSGNCTPQIHHRDGFEAVAALTPPKIKRGLVLTDPSYEDADEYVKAADTFCAVHEKWSAGILALWYPLLAHRKIECGIMKQKITASVRTSAEPCEILDAQLLVNTEDSHEETSLENASGSSSPRLCGSGMLIVNMPWKLDEELRAVLPYLADRLGTDGKGSSSVTVC